MSADCIFCKIGAEEIPVDLIYNDNDFVAFHDIAAQAPIHVLIIPKVHIGSLVEVSDAALLGTALVVVQAVAKQLGVEKEGFRTVINTGPNGGQSVDHLHFHLLAGRFMQWPPG